MWFRVEGKMKYIDYRKGSEIDNKNTSFSPGLKELYV